MAAGGSFRSDRDGVARDPDAILAWHDQDRESARPPHLDALDDLERGRRGDLAAIAEIGPEGSGSRACRGILDDAADGEWVARAETIGRLPPDELQGRQVVFEHEGLERFERVLESREPLGVAGGEDEVARARKRDGRRQRRIELVLPPAKE